MHTRMRQHRRTLQGFLSSLPERRFSYELPVPEEYSSAILTQVRTTFFVYCRFKQYGAVRVVAVVLVTALPTRARRWATLQHMTNIRNHKMPAHWQVAQRPAARRSSTSCCSKV